MPLLISAANPGLLTGAGNNTWLIEGREPTLIDAGIGKPAHIEALERVLAGEPLVRVLVTHSHADHASGVDALQARWPGVEIAKWTLESESGWRTLVEGERVAAGNGHLRVVHTPGHAPDHVCFWDEGTRDLYAGDMLVRGTTVMIPAGRGGNLRDYLASLARLAALRPARVLAGHGPIIDRPLELIEEYAEHRRLRESQILECLADGMADTEAIVDRIYPTLSPGVRPSARLTVEAHLEKLRDEGRALPRRP